MLLQVYWPTLIFKFKSADENKKFHYSQVKIRYYKKSNDIFENDIVNLKQKNQ